LSQHCAAEFLRLRDPRGNVLASHFAVNCLRPGIGERFVARARVVKQGKAQIFTACELFAQDGAGETLLPVVTTASAD
jgi:acyl-coenzyme A thioesterase PaaI-like protein